MSAVRHLASSWHLVASTPGSRHPGVAGGLARPRRPTPTVPHGRRPDCDCGPAASLKKRSLEAGSCSVGSTAAIFVSNLMAAVFSRKSSEWSGRFPARGIAAALAVSATTVEAFCTRRKTSPSRGRKFLVVANGLRLSLFLSCLSKESFLMAEKPFAGRRPFTTKQNFQSLGAPRSQASAGPFSGVLRISLSPSKSRTF